MPFRSSYSRPSSRRPSGAHRLLGLGKAVLFVGAIAAAVWFGFHQVVNSRLRNCVQEKMAERLEGTGLQISLGHARFHTGKGIHLHDLTIEHVGLPQFQVPVSARSRLEIYEAFLQSRVTTIELATEELVIQSLQVRRAKLTLVRDATGHWDIQDVFASLLLLKPEHSSPIPVSLNDCELRIIDLGNPGARPVTLSHINIEVQQRMFEGRPLLQIHGGFESAAVSKVEFTTFLDQQTQWWDTTLSVTGANISTDLLAIVPAAFQDVVEPLSLLAAEFNFTLNADGSMLFDEVPTFSLQGNVAQLAVDDARLPFSVREISGHFGIDNAGFTISNVHGKMGPSEFHVNYSQQGLLNRASWKCDGNLVGFRFDSNDRMSKWLPQYCKKFCHEYSPLGTCNVNFDLEFNQTWLKREITSELTSMAFTYVGLPYQIENCTGRVELSGNDCTFSIRSMMDEQLIQINGFANNIGHQPTYEVNISVPGALPFDQKMLAAIDARPAFSKIIREFNATGLVGGIAKIEKRVPGGKIIKAYDVRIQQCSLSHNGFEYPIHNISGLIQARNDTYRFSNLKGNNGKGSVICNGNWDPVNGLLIRFNCDSIALNDHLRDALRSGIREIWDGFRPRGTLDSIRIDLALPIGERDVDLVVEARMTESKDEAHGNYISIHPTWFPYEINHLIGTVNIGHGQIVLTDIKGQHQRTYLACGGTGRYSAEAWSVKLDNLLVGALKVDEDLLVAVPQTLAPAIRGLHYKGLLSVNGEMTLAGTIVDQPVTRLVRSDISIGEHRNDGPAATRNITNSDGRGIRQVAATVPVRQAATTMAWDLELGMIRAEMLIGLPLKNVSGKVRLAGVFDGEAAECQGELFLDSMTLYDAQITKVRGPIWLDNARVAAGIFARPQPGISTLNISPGNNQDVTRHITGEVHDGIINLDAQMNNTGRSSAFYVQTTIADSSLETACRDFAPQLEDIEGHCFAAFRMSGDFLGTHNNQGEGTIRLRNAKIYELPVFLSLLKILNARQVTRTAFDSSNIDFTIKGENINFSRMEFIGDAISLIGNGTMNLDRDIDLNFYSVMGRNRFYIPIISELYAASSQNILVINVDGKLDNPTTHPHVLKQLDDGIQALFGPRQQSDVQNRFQQDGQPIPSETRDLRFQSPDVAGRNSMSIRK